MVVLVEVVLETPVVVEVVLLVHQKIDAPDLPSASNALADQMVKYVGAFVATGHPISKGLPAWSKYGGTRHMMKFTSNQAGEFDGYAEHRCDWWKTLYPLP